MLRDSLLGRPLPTTIGSSVQLLAAIATGELTFPDPPRGADPDQHVLLRPWLARMLERDPAQRPQDATQVHRDLKAIVAKLEGRPAEARAFVAMPFATDLDALWRAVKAICLDCRVQPVRVDETITHENIWDEIRTEIENADLMIAVVSPEAGTTPNPNVMLEIGYMRALKRPIVILTGDPESLPFDLRTHRAVPCPAGSASDPAFHARLATLLRRIVDRTGGES